MNILAPVKVNEIFYSIQGESSFAGRPSAFVRLAACNLRCSYCDTDYAFHEGREMTTSDILEAIRPYPTKVVLVTGGEPLLQPSVHDLLAALLDRGYTVCLETGGHISVKKVDPRVHKIMDLKCPSSNMERHNLYENIRHLTRADEVKFVLADRGDFDWACDIVVRHGLSSVVSNILFSPVYGVLSYRDLARWVLESGLPVRMQLQLHKIIWGDDVRGF